MALVLFNRFANVIFLRYIEVKDNVESDRFPFNLPCFTDLNRLEFKAPVTFLVGENGSGKSTLLEALAAGLGAIAVGSNEIEHDETLAETRNFAKSLKFASNRKPRFSLFFRAEDIFGFTNRVVEMSRELLEIEGIFEKEISGSGKHLAMGSVRGQRNALIKDYGENPHAKSHGESFLHILDRRIQRNSLCLLDEPESPLSPLRQLSLIALIEKYSRLDCQFIVATHSPILMAIPGADILYFSENRIEQIDYNEVEHVTLTRSFLNNPERYLRLLNED